MPKKGGIGRVRLNRGWSPLWIILVGFFGLEALAAPTLSRHLAVYPRGFLAVQAAPPLGALLSAGPPARAPRVYRVTTRPRGPPGPRAFRPPGRLSKIGPVPGSLAPGFRLSAAALGDRPSVARPLTTYKIGILVYARYFSAPVSD